MVNEEELSLIGYLEQTVQSIMRLMDKKKMESSLIKLIPFYLVERGNRNLFPYEIQIQWSACIS